MSQRDESIYLGDILDAARRALRLVDGKSRAGYDEDETLRLALVYLVQTIGEAARHVSAVTRKSHPSIPWHKIVAMRHKLVHDYMNVDEDLLWETVTMDLSPLVAELEKIVPPDPPAQDP